MIDEATLAREWPALARAEGHRPRMPDWDRRAEAQAAAMHGAEMRAGSASLRAAVLEHVGDEWITSPQIARQLRLPLANVGNALRRCLLRGEVEMASPKDVRVDARTAEAVRSAGARRVWRRKRDG